MKSKYFLLTALILSLLTVAQSQMVEESLGAAVPDKTMRNVVERILQSEFKPPDRKEIIYLAQDNIRPTWLPSITNIKFRFLSDAQREDRGIKVHFFTKPMFSKGTYNIEFASGDPDCSYEGDLWQFRILAAGIDIRKIETGNGRYCSAGQFRVPGKMNTYAGELPDYKFFNRGKLKDIRLGISTPNDIKRNFGKNCEYNCEYDQNWNISFNYFGNTDSQTIINGEKIQYIPYSQYVGKLSSISLYPKLPLSFSSITFPAYFKTDTHIYAGGRSEGGGSYSGSDIIYNDKYGLDYTIIKDFKSTNNKIHYEKGQLQSISYTIPEKIKEKVFVQRKSLAGL